MKENNLGLSRRELVFAAVALPAMSWGGAFNVFAASGEFQPTPECRDPDDPTPAQTPGPFFKPRSPQRTSFLEEKTRGDRIVLEGRVLSTRCTPIARALLDFWHADASGAYDNAGYQFRGHQFTDEQGRYRLETIVPGIYPGRTRHFHVRAQAPGGRMLTTQLYFPGEAENKRDGLFDPKLLVSLRESAGLKLASFHFVLSVS
ncbi:MAG TPA: hypothetical protein VNL14_00085 [Candidatus Acidoferrales bacterium]|nr:hypothetical protein [Candidatus Acidoferrales bacterium]